MQGCRNCACSRVSSRLWGVQELSFKPQARQRTRWGSAVSFEVDQALLFGGESFDGFYQVHCRASTFLIFSRRIAILFAQSVTASSMPGCWQILDRCFSRIANSVLSSASVSAMRKTYICHAPVSNASSCWGIAELARKARFPSPIFGGLSPPISPDRMLVRRYTFVTHWTLLLTNKLGARRVPPAATRLVRCSSSSVAFATEVGDQGGALRTSRY